MPKPEWIFFLRLLFYIIGWSLCVSVCVSLCWIIFEAVTIVDWYTLSLIWEFKVISNIISGLSCRVFSPFSVLPLIFLWSCIIICSTCTLIFRSRYLDYLYGIVTLISWKKAKLCQNCVLENCLWITGQNCRTFASKINLQYFSVNWLGCVKFEWDSHLFVFKMTHKWGWDSQSQRVKIGSLRAIGMIFDVSSSLCFWPRISSGFSPQKL